MNQNQIKSILDKIKNVKVAVYGDFCLDAYWIIDQKGSELSIETGLKTETVLRHYYTPGGAGNVVANLSALLPFEIKAIGVIGNDIFGRELSTQLQTLGADTDSLFIQEENFSTYTYLKRLSEGQEESRIDFGIFNKRSLETDQKILDSIEAALNEYDALIFNQQVTGSISNEAFIADVNRLFEKYNHKIIMLDSRHFNHKFQNTCLKANDREIASLVGININPDKNISIHDVVKYGRAIFEKSQKPVFVTCGENGIIAFDKHGHYEIPGIKLEGRLDTVGAGDTAVSAITLCLAAGISVSDAAQFANFAAAVTVQKLHTTGTATGEEILEIFLSMLSQTEKQSDEIQITHDLAYHHDLDNNDNFSPDGEWLVYDTRTDESGIAASARIEKVNVKTGEIKVLYRVKNNEVWGPGVGAVSYSPKENSVVFIHGLESSTKENPYQQWRRTGVIIEDSNPDIPVFMDARDVVFPFTPGALRGGTHRHEWSGDGQWIGFTYNDAILKALEDSTGVKRNLRTIGVSKKIKPVQVNENPENVSGEWFSALVVRVVPEPKPGSDEINHAANDSWIGTKGYLRSDGKKQIARAFLGTVTDKNGSNVQEVFVVDIPDDISKPGKLGPLEGTADDFPMPPEGTIQRRLTFTADTKYPGCSGIVRSSPDGNNLAFLAKDANGVEQVFLLSPNGSRPEQITEHKTGISGNLRWHPDGKHVSYVYDGRIVLCEIGKAPFKDRLQTLTAPTNPAPTNIVWSHDGKRIAFNRLVKDESSKNFTMQIFVKSYNID